ncbi:MAG: iron complex outermembrane receptor protein [Saprospiraceae bacterium]|jgi:iron complex outermembrane receptor protein
MFGLSLHFIIKNTFQPNKMLNHNDSFLFSNKNFSMKLVYTLLLAFLFFGMNAQNTIIKGQLQDADGTAIVFANVVLHLAVDSSLVKVETTDEAGLFQIRNVAAGNYFIKASYVGLPDFIQNDIELSAEATVDLGVLSFAPQAVELQQATVTATRALVEIKPDRTVFNVQGTINSVGSNAIELLRKAPSVNVDNNDNVSVLGRAGVLVYLDGKRLPLSGVDLANYLKTLPAEQIDRMDIITNPGARYEAEGNAGIIDIIMKKDKSLGANGSIGGTLTRGQRTRYNLNGLGNYRNKKMNVFGTLGYGDTESFNNMRFRSFQNDITLVEEENSSNDQNYYNYRLGTDFFMGQNHIIGFLVTGREGDNLGDDFNRIEIGSGGPVDSILVANNVSEENQKQNTFNLNYRFSNKIGRTLNVDFDYGRYQNEATRFQPNTYFNPTEEVELRTVVNSFDTPTDIDIYTFQVDYEEERWGGKIGTGAKLSRVMTENIFDIFKGKLEDNNRIDEFSNEFDYDENVTAGYISYARPLGKKWNISTGLRAEYTDAQGDFRGSQTDSLTNLNYLSWFPNVGLTWQIARTHVLALSYGRRINRPDYNVLNPFINRLSEISFSEGNPGLSPEIVNNIELGYTLAYRFNFKLAYSRTEDQITRIISPSDIDPRATTIFWDNLAKKTVVSFNASLPFQVKEWWNVFLNVNASHIHNEADYGDGAVIDLKTFSYNFFTQNTFKLPKGFTAEVGGYFGGPGIWGGVFKYKETWSLNLGLQRKFLQDKLNVKLSANDLFYEAGWDGVSRFNGLESFGNGNWDSRNVSLSLNYSFGNQNVKSRKRKTSIESEAGRVGK